MDSLSSLGVNYTKTSIGQEELYMEYYIKDTIAYCNSNN